MSTGMIATTWDIYDSFFDQNKSPDNDKDDYTESSVGTSKDQEKSGEKSGSSSSYTVATGNSTCVNINVQFFVPASALDWRGLGINNCVCSKAIHSITAYLKLGIKWEIKQFLLFCNQTFIIL